MKVYKYRALNKPAKKVEPVKIAVIRFDIGLRNPYVVQLWGDSGMTVREPKYFITKTAAKGWIELNHPYAELKDLTGQG